MSTQRLPQTDSIQALAEFWDTHDLAEFEGQLEEVSEPVFERANTVTLRLEAGEAEAVKRMARSRGVNDAELIHQWVREKLSGS